MSRSWYPPRWRPSYPFGQAALLAAGISPDEARRDRPCPEVHRRKRDANCACTLPCDRNGNCSWPIAKCKSLSWCAGVTLSDKRDWGTLKALGPAIGIDSALRPLPRGNALTLLIGEQKCGTTALHEMIAPAHTQRSSIKERHWLDMDHYISVCRMDEVLRNSFLETGTRGKRNLQNLRGSGIALLDATPDYLADPFAAADHRGGAAAASSPRTRQKGALLCALFSRGPSSGFKDPPRPTIGPRSVPEPAATARNDSVTTLKASSAARDLALSGWSARASSR